MVGAEVTYHAQCAVSRLQGAEMTRVGLLPPQDAVPRVHPPQAGMRPEVRPLALEAAHRGVGNDAGSRVSPRLDIISWSVTMPSAERSRMRPKTTA